MALCHVSLSGWSLVSHAPFLFLRLLLLLDHPYIFIKNNNKNQQDEPNPANQSTNQPSMPENELMAAYKSVPIITRTMLTATIFISIGVAVHLVPYNLIYLDWSLILYRFQVRLSLSLSLSRSLFSCYYLPLSLYIYTCVCYRQSKNIIFIHSRQRNSLVLFRLQLAKYRSKGCSRRSFLRASTFRFCLTSTFCTHTGPNWRTRLMPVGLPTLPGSSSLPPSFHL